MKGFRSFILIGAAGLVTALQAQAAVIDLQEIAFNVDGTVTDYLWANSASTPVTAPGGVNISGFNTAVGLAGYGTGLGTITYTYTFSGIGHHYFGLFVDHEIDQETNLWTNEFGSTSGSAVSGQSWQIDEPGVAKPPAYVGSIFDNFGNRALDGTNHVPSGANNDVSLALAWDFDLVSGDTAVITYLISPETPRDGFYLQQTDPNSQASIYLSSALRISNGGGNPVPEPATLGLVSLALLGVWQARRRPAHS